MIRLRVVILAGAALVNSTGCHHVKAPASAVKMADAASANQLLYGFYHVEMHAWRWTMREFAVGLKPPQASAQRGAKLRLDAYIPEVQIQELGPMTLCASAAGHPLESETFSTPGTHTYWRDVPAEVLDSNIVPFVFSFDKYTPRAVNRRELGVVVSAVGLVGK